MQVSVTCKVLIVMMGVGSRQLKEVLSRAFHEREKVDDNMVRNTRQVV